MTRHPWLTAAVLVVLSGCGNEAANHAEAARLAELQTRLRELLADIDHARDVSEIKKLQRTYGYYLDKGLADDMADLFTDDEPSAGYESGAFIGKKSIRNAFRYLGPNNSLPEGKMMTHMQVQGLVNVAPDGKTAQARWRAVAFTASAQQGRMQEGPYEVEYVKEDGIWKIKKLQWFQTFGAPYDGGWPKLKPPPGPPDAAALARAAQIPKPDRPEPGKTWPEVTVPPYHYKNPVTGR